MKKYKILIISIVFIGFIIVAKADEYITDLPLLGKIIYVDAGHGGIDPGAISNKLYEKDINLKIAEKLRDELISKGAIVYMTRETDKDLANKYAVQRKRSDLYNRAKMINNSDCDLYLSIHLNASPSSRWRGAQAFYNDINSVNEEIAKIMQKNFKKTLYSTRKETEMTDLYMYKIIKKPGLLLEVGFISNPNDRGNLKVTSYQVKIAKTITKGVVEYFN